MNHEDRTGGASVWTIALPAVALLAITMASRASFGLFLSPINTATGIGVATISFAVALSQLTFGAAQPVAGALADRYGAARVVAVSAIGLSLALAAIPLAASGVVLVLVMGLIGISSAGAGSASVLLSAVSRQVAVKHRGLMGGLVGAGGPIGQLVFTPAAQATIVTAGWATAMFALSALSLAALPLARRLRQRSVSPATESGQANRPARGSDASHASALAALREASRSASYWVVTGAFFVCGFHVSFLLAHMPGAIQLCGLPASLSGASLALMGLFNIASSIVSGLVIQRFSMKLTLATIYALRGVGVAAFLIAPKTEVTVLGFAVWMGLTYMATLPPTTGLIGKLFGTRHLGTLLGTTMFVHQVGSFLGVWLGGIALEATGSFDWMWRLDIALAAAAALVCLAIREPGDESNKAPSVEAPDCRPASAGA
ncbi:MAG: MFS transporter [Betaproteobacteria bacterium]|nr:MFS transporter [Betaproteobacteria bacterium]